MSAVAVALLALRLPPSGHESGGSNRITLAHKDNIPDALRMMPLGVPDSAWPGLSTVSKMRPNNFKGNYSIGIMENKMETTIIQSGDIEIMENKMETTIIYRGSMAVSQK